MSLMKGSGKKVVVPQKPVTAHDARQKRKGQGKSPMLFTGGKSG